MEKTTFASIALSEEVLRAIEEMNYTETTEIQAGAIPLILAGNDVIGRSSTGTGKTAAFGIPAVESILEGKKPQVLILCPTRELAMQIAGEIKKYAKYKKSVNLAVVYGGQSMDLQIRQLKTANIVIGTPGRIMDHMSRRTLKLDELRTVILDEADEMLNMGFYEDIQMILGEVPEERQTILFSATMPAAIMKITAEFQKDPEIVAVDKGKRTLGAITQYYYQVPQVRKMDALNLLLQMYRPVRSVIFCNTKKMVDELTEYLEQNGFRALGLHGDMKQSARTQVMQSFKNNRTNILVATDVAARGIDVENIEAVFNFDIPQEFEYYIHRIGRTARAGKTGYSYTFACNRMQVRKIEEIERFVGAPIKPQPLPSAQEVIAQQNTAFVEKILTRAGEGVGEENAAVVDSLLESEYTAEQLCTVLIGMVSGRAKRPIPVFAEPERVDQRNGGDRGARPSARVRLKISAGREQRIAPNYIVGAIVDSTGLPAKAIGKIDIFPDHSVVELTAEDAKLVLETMQNTKIHNCKISVTAMPPKPQGQREYRGGGSFNRGRGENRGGERRGYTKSTGFNKRTRKSDEE